MAIKVLVYSEEEEFASQIKGRLSATGLMVNAESNADEAARFLADEGADVCLFTASDSSEQDLATLRRFKSAAPSAGIILLERGDNVDFIMKARAQGVLDTVLIPFDLDELLRTIQTAAPQAN